MSNETLMTDATATTPEGEPASQPTDQTPATGADTTGQQPSATETRPADDGQQGNPPAEPKTDDKPQGAPEKYEFQPTEGVEIDPGVVETFADVAKELNLSQEAAQTMLNKMAPALATRQTEQLRAASEHWANESRNDKEFGGEALGENLAHAKKALDAFATPELRTLLNDSGLGNHPEVVRFMVRVGKANGEDSFVSGASGRSNTNDPKRLYPNSNMN